MVWRRMLLGAMLLGAIGCGETGGGASTNTSNDAVQSAAPGSPPPLPPTPPTPTDPFPTSGPSPGDGGGDLPFGPGEGAPAPYGDLEDDMWKGPAVADGNDLSFYHRGIDENGLPKFRELARGDHRFLCALYGAVRSRESGNVCLSPVSVSAAMAMVYAGASGETAGELAQALALDGSADEIHERMKRRLDLLQLDGPGVRVSAANRLWGSDAYRINPAYIERLSRQYGADLQSLDFAGAPDRSSDMINGWVSAQTRGRIPQLVDASMFGRATRLVLTNAIYFHGAWRRRFAPESTRPALFRVPSGGAVEVSMMAQTAAFPYARFDDLQLLELPYAGGTHSMVILLPAEVDGLPALEARLTDEQLDAWQRAMTLQTVEVELPKLAIESRTTLSDALQALGARRVFEAGRAELSGIGDGELSVSTVVHRAMLEIDEEGTTAAAATAVGMRGGPAQNESFHVDRPFLTLIRDNRSGDVLFVARVVSPPVVVVQAR